MMINVISQHLPGCGDAFEVCLCTGSTHELGVTKMTAVFALLYSLTGIAVSALSKIWSSSTWPKDGDLEIEQPANANRCRGSGSVDCEKLRRLTASHLLQIAKSIDY